jgi:hypothetical protein
MLGRLNRVEADLTPFDAGGPAAIHHRGALTRICCCDLTTRSMLGRDYAQARADSPVRLVINAGLEDCQGATFLRTAALLLQSCG